MRGFHIKSIYLYSVPWTSLPLPVFNIFKWLKTCQKENNTLWHMKIILIQIWEFITSFHKLKIWNLSKNLWKIFSFLSYKYLHNSLMFCFLAHKTENSCPMAFYRIRVKTVTDHLLFFFFWLCCAGGGASHIPGKHATIDF
jgi:hypothetical protein